MEASLRNLIDASARRFAPAQGSDGRGTHRNAMDQGAAHAVALVLTEVLYGLVAGPVIEHNVRSMLLRRAVELGYTKWQGAGPFEDFDGGPLYSKVYDS